MKNKAIALGITLALALPGMAMASPLSYGYDGHKLSTKNGPTYEPQTLDEVTENARKAEKLVRLQDQPDAKTEEITSASQETVKEQKKRLKEGKKTESESTLPITIYGDQVIYDSETGDFRAQGNVRLYQGSQKLYTAQAHGNSKTGDIYLETGGRIINSSGGTQSVTDGKWGHYNFLDKTGTIKEISGSNGTDLYRADIGQVYPDRVELTEGARTTKCPAVKHPPCVEVRANKVVIYPKDKLIAYGVKVYVKGKHIYSRDRWINRFGEGGEQSLMPHIGYSDDHGTEIRYNLDIPVSESNTLRANLKYYSKIGWRPLFTDVQDFRNFYIQVTDGHDEDGDNNWIRKKHDIKIGYKSHKFDKRLPLNYSFYYSRGLWKDKWKQSWHSEYGGFLTHDPIRLTHEERPLYLNLGIGHKWTDEEEAKDKRSTSLYSATLRKSFDGGWNTWLGYYYERPHNSIFNYSNPDMEKEVQYGLSKQFGHTDNLAFITRYNEGEHSVYEYIYRWTHDFCCFRVGIEYRDKQYINDHEWSVTYDLYRW